MRQQHVAKVTISLPQELLDYADRLARERSTTRSGLIAALLEQEEQARIQALMEQGYREMAEENRSLAEEAFPIVAEALRKSTRWDEGVHG